MTICPERRLPWKESGPIEGRVLKVMDGAVMLPPDSSLIPAGLTRVKEPSAVMAPLMEDWKKPVLRCLLEKSPPELVMSREPPAGTSKRSHWSSAF